MRSRTPSLLLVLGCLVLAGALLTAGEPGPATLPPEEGALAFRLAGANATGPELNLAVDSAGTLFVGGWRWLSRSEDGGLAWTRMNLSHLRYAWYASDRVIALDPATDRLFVVDTYGACVFVAFSDDRGRAWTRNPAACPGGYADHPKVGVGRRTAFPPDPATQYPSVVYVCANSLAYTSCAASGDGGLTFVPVRPHGTSCAFQGALLAGPDGTLYEPAAHCGHALRYTEDNGLTWTERRVPHASSKDAPDLALDAAGTLYEFYTDASWKPSVLRTRDRGLTWEGPFAVPLPGVVSAVFPAAVAGDAGRVALSFYATLDAAPGWDGNPGTAPAGVRWHGYVALVTGADGPSPAFEVVRITPDGDPLQYGCLSKLGNCLFTNGNIADYMDIAALPDGRIAAVFVDGCLPGCASQGQSHADLAVVAVQEAGPTLRAPPPAPPEEPAGGPAARPQGLDLLPLGLDLLAG